MPGWIIQGVRGEGKSLAAVGKIREYLEQGRPVATNLDLNLEKLLPADNNTACYRLPDHPRIQDLQALPPAYDPKYKGEDRNGLLVLDELGTWLNARSWNDKTRLAILNWLFLSRKEHWDLILLAQDHEMIDAQVRNTLCDYLVQASRLDRQKIPYLAPALEALGINSFMPKIHVYAVYYGLSTQVPPVEKWRFSGKEIYDGYDTNQRFRDGSEALNGSIVDMRAIYQYLPPAYLTNQIHIDKHLLAIEKLKKMASSSEAANDEKNFMAVRKGAGDNPQLKAYLLIAAAGIFLAWRFMSGGFSIPGDKKDAAPVASVSPGQSSTAANTQPIPVTQQQPPTPPQPQPQPTQQPLPPPTNSPHRAIESNFFIDTMLANYKPRLAAHAYSDETGFLGFLEWYDGATLVEKLNLNDLHAFGVALVKKAYGVELVYGAKRYVVTSWPKQAPDHVQNNASNSNHQIQLSKNP